jgi:hypothetical protein
MKSTSTQFPFARVQYGQQPFGVRVRCVLDSSLLVQPVQVTGLAIEATYGMEPYFGFGPFSKGIVRAVGQNLGRILGRIDFHGGTTIIYWGTNNEEKIQLLGYREGWQWESFNFSRPIDNFGTTSCMLSAVNYFLDGTHLASRPLRREDLPGIFVFLLDGPVSDFSAVYDQVRQAAFVMQKGDRKPDHLIFAAIGADYLEKGCGQIQALAACNNQSDPPLFTSLIVPDTDSVAQEVGAAVMSYVRVIYPGMVRDLSGQRICDFSDGLPGAFQFYLPSGAKAFTLEMNGTLFRQELVG